MKGLRTARVLVVDDDPREAEPLLRGLGRLGIGSLYFNGDFEDLPDEPFRGVRLVFLDLRLGTGLTETTHAVGQTVNVLKQLVHPTRGETAVVLWTKHEEDASSFEQVLRRNWPDFEPAFSVILPEKLRFIQTAEPAPSPAKVAGVVATGASDEAGAPSMDAGPRAPLGIDALRNRISGALTDPACRLLWEWEQCIHDAASATVGTLLQMKAKRPTMTLMTVLAHLAEAPGQKIIDGHTALSGLFEGLNPVHADKLRQLARDADASGPHVDELLGLLREGNLPELKAPEYALLNRFMLADRGSCGTPYPGDVFLEREWEGTFPGEPAAGVKTKIINEICKKPEDRTRFEQAAELCLTEISAACDFAQGKTANARLLYGLLIKGPDIEAGGKPLSVSESNRVFARQIQFININEQARGMVGDYRLIMNARWLCSVPVFELAKQTSIIRLREQLVTDIRAWFASHASRPGYVSLGG